MDKVWKNKLKNKKIMNKFQLKVFNNWPILVKILIILLIRFKNYKMMKLMKLKLKFKDSLKNKNNY